VCGIVGLVDFKRDNISQANLQKMSKCLKHRGPDAEGIWTMENVGFGHTRLAILDLSPDANQPMISADSRYVITYNGEIYNHAELRNELEKKGYKFRTHSDTEVVLNSLMEWNEKAFIKFNGIFALAFYDTRKKRMLIARDRCGVKPLYLFENDGYLAFASEQKSILKLEGFKKDLDIETLYEYMTFQNIFTDKTLVKGINLFPAGHYLEIYVEEQSTRRAIQYWDFEFQEQNDKTREEEYVEEFKEIFSRSVKSQMLADVEVGAYLSGGIDSTSIAAVAAQIKQIKTFTVGFESSSNIDEKIAYDERENSQLIATALDTDHYEYALKPSDIESCLNELMESIEEPRIGQSYPNYYAAKLASNHVKVVLSGAGGDELFGGYPWRYFRGIKTGNFQDYLDQYYLYWQRLLPNSELKKLFSPVKNRVSHVWTRDIFEGVFNNHKFQSKTQNDFVNNALYFESKTFLHSLLILEDKISMSFGLESRVPFLDNDMVNFATKLPIKYKIRNLENHYRLDENISDNKPMNFYNMTRDGKLLVRKALPELVPGFVKNDIKRGFTSPDLLWFRNENRDFVVKTILNRKNKLYDIFDFNQVRSYVHDYFEERSNSRLLIWSFLSLSAMLEKF